MRQKILIIFFLIFIGGFGLLHVLVEDRHFSEAENRILAKFPSPTFKSIVSGTFTSAFEQYVSDQFVWKTFWVGLKADAERVALKRENNGVYIGKDGFLLEKYEEPGEQLQRNIHHIEKFLQQTKEIQTYMLLAPTSIEIYQDKLPAFVHVPSQKETLDEVERQLGSELTFIHVYNQLFNKKAEQIYFKTDHHWTMRGAYYAYEMAAKEMGFTPYRIDDFQIQTVSTDFYGTLYSKANAYRMQPDKIELFEPMFKRTFEVQYGESGVTKTSLYEWDHLETKDQYSFFLNGNQAHLQITSDLQNGRKLAVIKDSYAHIFIPFLANHYEEIHVLDLRYYHKDIYDYLSSHQIGEVLFLYNITNFTQDPNFVWLEY